ncbi:MAG TPA: hypothetical protein VEB40_00675 [Flavipsychrobacter sp.]|nr:hypothetical protein [Flavipsychrobacter sp.]
MKQQTSNRDSATEPAACKAWPGSPPGPAFPDSLFFCDEGLKKLVKNCSDMNALFTLYYENRYRVGKKLWLQQLFAERQRELERIYCCNAHSENLG